MTTPPAGLEIVDLDPFDDAAFDAWHGVYLRAQRALGAAATPWQLEELRASMQHAGSAAWLGGWSAVVDGEAVGAGFIRTPLLDNLELVELDVHVAPDRQRQGIGTALLAHAEAAARRRGRTVVTGLVGWSWEAGPLGDGEPGPLFARARGYELALTEVQRELALPVDDSVLAALADEAALAHPTYHLRSGEGPVPDELLQASRPDITGLTTYNAEVNTHMVAVNEAMGFRPVGRLGDFQKRLS